MTDTAGRFTGTVALITGAASGIGRATALRLAGEGAQVLAHDLNADGLTETAELAAKAAGTVHVRAGDVSQRQECRDTVAECLETFGRLDVLGNVAGMARGEHVTEVGEADYRRMMGVNV